MSSHGNDCQKNLDFSLKTRSFAETVDLGYKIGTLLNPGDVIAIVGELGAGKTQLSKGIAYGVDVADHEYVNSPAYDLIHEYQGRLAVYHMDFYRLEILAAEDLLWMDEYLNGEGVCLIEWGDKFIQQLCQNYLKVGISFVNGENEREINITAMGTRYNNIIQGLKQQC